ncbi:MAG: ABC transporter ATP-binding protein [Gammaproteobacteria bacterium]|nr:ABC transporter ATP-binding protein [Gammaproteobacteria bacterium]
MADNILEVSDLKKHFVVRKGIFPGMSEKQNIPAVDGISFSIKKGETLGLVGESGCGKTTTGKAIMGLNDITSGAITFNGNQIANLTAKEFKPYRKDIQMIFQDLDAALNPKMQIGDLIKEAVVVHDPGLSKEEIQQKVLKLLDLVNLKKSQISNYPTELSGGEKRRVGLARTLAMEPKFIVADEPTSALDVSIQAQVVNLLLDLQQKLDLTFLFISHDLPLVELVSHNVGVMYLGKIVEMGPSAKVAKQPRHPYTAILWSSIVGGDTSRGLKEDARSTADWQVYDHSSTSRGCKFAPRCPVFAAKAEPSECSSVMPVLSDAGDGHLVACHFPLNN